MDIKNGKIHNIDCIEFLKNNNKKYDIIFADPPFNLNKFYGDNFKDKMSEEDYLKWCYKWIDLCIESLNDGGSLFIYNIPKWNIFLSNYLMTKKDSSGKKVLDFKHWITVDFKCSMPLRNRLYPAHYSLLYFTKGKSNFNKVRTPIPQCRHCKKDIKDYGGHRKKIHADGLNITDIWTDFSPVRHKSTKNRPANELPIGLIQRCLEIVYKDGDVVFDPFMGSGTTAEASENLGLKWEGCEINDIEYLIKRIKSI